MLGCIFSKLLFLYLRTLSFLSNGKNTLTFHCKNSAKFNAKLWVSLHQCFTRLIILNIFPPSLKILQNWYVYTWKHYHCFKIAKKFGPFIAKMVGNKHQIVGVAGPMFCSLSLYMVAYCDIKSDICHVPPIILQNSYAHTLEHYLGFEIVKKRLPFTVKIVQQEKG